MGFYGEVYRRGYVWAKNWCGSDDDGWGYVWATYGLEMAMSPAPYLVVLLIVK